MSRPRRRIGQQRTAAVRYTSHYHRPDSPLDGVARAVRAGLLLLAQLNLDRVTSHVTCPVTCHTEHRDHEAELGVALTDELGAPLTLAAVAEFVDFPRAQVKRSLELLEQLGELGRDARGAFVLLRFTASQASPDTLRKRRQREREREREAASSPPNGVTSHTTSHAPRRDLSRSSTVTSHVTSHAHARAVSDLKEGEIKISNETTTTLETPKERTRAQAYEPTYSDEQRYELDDEQLDPSEAPRDLGAARAQRGYRWLQSLLASAGSLRVMLPLGGKWQAGYSLIGARPDRELEAVTRFVLPHLRAGTLKERCMTPRHLADHWQIYLDEQLPFEFEPTSASSSSSVMHAPSDDEYAADAARNPDWLAAEDAHT
jgi:hypothetical protein